MNIYKTLPMLISKHVRHQLEQDNEKIEQKNAWHFHLSLAVHGTKKRRKMTLRIFPYQTRHFYHPETFLFGTDFQRHIKQTSFLRSKKLAKYHQRPSIDLNKCSYLDQILPQHESLYPIGLISARIKILHIGNFSTK